MPPKSLSRLGVTLIAASILSTMGSACAAAEPPEPQWRHLSSTNGALPTPGASTEQTGAVVADFDKDGTNDFVLSFRKVAPALVWYRRTTTGWDRYVIETNFLTVEAGGAVFDIDGDGAPDLVFGGDYQSREVWWWENPYPHFNPKVPWKRHTIKKGGATQQHDQVFGDFLGTGKPQLAFWNQGARKIFLAQIPAHPREASSWPLLEIFSWEAGAGGRKTAFQYPEGMAAYDIDGDGQVDLLAGNL
ncbi:MAG: FG-GAP repeat domain-containing protein, partial [Limisphaerales bacterium]